MLDLSKTIAIIPAYNEEKPLPKVLESIQAEYPGLDILVIDDCSHDKTALVARKAGVRVISHLARLRYGVAIQTGYKYAHRHGYEFLVQLDADGQHDTRDIGKLLEKVQDGSCEIAFGSRFLGKSNYRPSLFRRIGILFFRNLLWFFVRRRVSDPTTGFQAMNRKVLEFFIQDYFPCDFPDADIIILLNKLNLRVQELPVRMYCNQQGKSMHSNPMSTLYYVFKMVMSMFLTQYRKL